MRDLIHHDIIADIHGRFDKLTALMARLGYAGNGESFVPPSGHRAVFLGDLIDTKPGHPFPGGVRATLRAVKAMCDRGDALCVMGNHEWSAILYHTKGPDGQWLKPRGDRNQRTHQGTLNDFPDHADPAGEWRTVWLPWLKSLPISLDLGGFRAVHACWHPGHLARLAGASLADDRFLATCADKCTPEAVAIDAVLKGIEVRLPDGHFFHDHTGTKRNQFRARWWEGPDADVVCSNLVFPASDQIGGIPVDPAARRMFSPYPDDARPVFFGHYFKPANSPTHPERHNVACLDHSAATGGPLIAYRWKGESSINPENYHCQL
ncbi:MAG: hypothetical protein K9N23_02795 [Akkermansiaceae bacterium]|nr:hypothetical protein [Akkermansiaceae bacterium]MCF7730581.1 hypothetical protein [Akkermansiaceae bacterium]